MVRIRECDKGVQDMFMMPMKPKVYLVKTKTPIKPPASS
jgi:hypothetical protein